MVNGQKIKRNAPYLIGMYVWIPRLNIYKSHPVSIDGRTMYVRERIKVSEIPAKEKKPHRSRPVPFWRLLQVKQPHTLCCNAIGRGIFGIR